MELDTFKTMVSQNKFLEWAVFSGNHYGTSLEALEVLQKNGKVPLLDIDLEGVKSVHRLNDKVNARFVFIRAPSQEILKQRLVGRGTETEASLKMRLDTALKELQHAEAFPETHDLVIVNDDLDLAFKQLDDFLFKN